MQPLIKKVISDLVGGAFCSLIGFLFFIWIEAGYSLEYNDGHHAVFTGLVSLPIGSIIGIFLVEKLLFKFQGINIMGLIIGSAMSCCLGGVISIILLKTSVLLIVVVPMIYAFFSIAGFHYKKTLILLSNIFLKSEVPL